jgi:hypothetical protein
MRNGLDPWPRQPETAFRNPLMEVSREQFSGPFPAMSPLPPRHVIEGDRSRAAPPRVQQDVAKDLAGVLVSPYALGHDTAELGHNVAHSQYGPALFNALGVASAVAPIPGMKGRPPVPRKLEGGFYSHLDEVLSGLSPKDTVTLDTLAKKGVKRAELEARGLIPMLGPQGAKVGDLSRVAAENPIRLQEARYGGEEGLAGPAKWEEYSGSHGNPTYEERVTYMPLSDEQKAKAAFAADYPTKLWEDISEADRRYLTAKHSPTLYRSGHFDEPNIISHYQRSIEKTPDGSRLVPWQVQSDWGQSIRDGQRNAYAQKLFNTRFEDATPEQRIAISRQIQADGPNAIAGSRDEARIAELRDRTAKAEEAFSQHADRLQEQLPDFWQSNRQGHNWASFRQHPTEFGPWSNIPDVDAVNNAVRNINLLRAELRTAETSAPGHPMVNTTDQWGLQAARQLLIDAVAENAAGISTPTGGTVLSYNPGKQAGMEGFYGDVAGRNGIFPTILENELRRLGGKDYRRGTATLQYPDGPMGSGRTSEPFHDFPFTPKIVEEVKKGLPLFSAAGAVAAPSLVNILARDDQDWP